MESLRRELQAHTGELESRPADFQDQFVQAELLECVRERQELLGAESHGRILAPSVT